MNIFHPDTTTVLYILASIVIPFVTSLVAQAHWDGFVLGLISLALSTVNGFVTTWADSSHANHYNWQTAVTASLFSFAIAFLARRQLLKDTKVDAKLLAVGSTAGAHEQAAA